MADWTLGGSMTGALRTLYDAGADDGEARENVVFGLRDIMNRGATLYLTHNGVTLPPITLGGNWYADFDGAHYKMTQHDISVLQDFPKDSGDWSAVLSADGVGMSLAPDKFATSVTISDDITPISTNVKIRIYIPMDITDEIKPLPTDDSKVEAVYVGEYIGIGGDIYSIEAGRAVNLNDVQISAGVAMRLARGADDKAYMQDDNGDWFVWNPITPAFESSTEPVRYQKRPVVVEPPDPGDTGAVQPTIAGTGRIGTPITYSASSPGVEAWWFLDNHRLDPASPDKPLIPVRPYTWGVVKVGERKADGSFEYTNGIQVSQDPNASDLIPEADRYVLEVDTLTDTSDSWDTWFGWYDDPDVPADDVRRNGTVERRTRPGASGHADAATTGTLNYNPHSRNTSSGYERMVARKMTSAEQELSNPVGEPAPMTYLSGVKTYRDTPRAFCYREFSVMGPVGKGAWKESMALPIDGGWPPEVEVSETDGTRLSQHYINYRIPSTNPSGDTSINAFSNWVSLPGGRQIGDRVKFGAEELPGEIRYDTDGTISGTTANGDYLEKYPLIGIAVGGAQTSEFIVPADGTSPDQFVMEWRYRQWVRPSLTTYGPTITAKPALQVQANYSAGPGIVLTIVPGTSSDGALESRTIRRNGYAIPNSTATSTYTIIADDATKTLRVEETWIVNGERKTVRSNPVYVNVAATWIGSGDPPSPPDVIEVTGSNLVVNGEFTTSVTGWSPEENAALSHDVDALRITSNGTGFAAASQIVPTTPGGEYQIKFAADIGTSGAPPTLSAGMPGTWNDLLDGVAPGVYNVTAVGGSIELRLMSNTTVNGEYVNFDDVWVIDLNAGDTTPVTTPPPEVGDPPLASVDFSDGDLDPGVSVSNGASLKADRVELASSGESLTWTSSPRDGTYDVLLRRPDGSGYQFISRSIPSGGLTIVGPHIIESIEVYVAGTLTGSTGVVTPPAQQNYTAWPEETAADTDFTPVGGATWQITGARGITPSATNGPTADVARLVDHNGQLKYQNSVTGAWYLYNVPFDVWNISTAPPNIAPLGVAPSPAPAPAPAPPAPVELETVGAAGAPSIQGYASVSILPGQTSSFDFTVTGDTRSDGNGYTTWVDQAWGYTEYLGTTGSYRMHLNASGLAEGSYVATLNALNDAGTTVQTIDVAVTSDAGTSPAPAPAPGPTPAPAPGPAPAPTPVPASQAGTAGTPDIEAYDTVYVANGDASATFDFVVSGDPQTGGGYTTYTNEAWSTTAYLTTNPGGGNQYRLTVDATGLSVGTTTTTLVATNDAGATQLVIDVVVGSYAGAVDIPTPGPGNGPSIVVPDPPAPGAYVKPTSDPEFVPTWYLDTETDPVYWHPTSLGLHDSSGNGSDPPTGLRADWPVPFPYDATRSHDRTDSTYVAATQWARCETSPGVYNFDPIFEWIDDNPDRFRTFVLFAPPTFHQIYPGESWGYGYISGGASPASATAVTNFTVALFAACDARYGEQVIHIFEVWNEPIVWYNVSDPSADRIAPTAFSKFYRGTSYQYADMVVAAGEAIPANVGLAVGAYEGQSDGNDNHLIHKVADRLIALGKMHLVTVWSFHQYVYEGASAWWRCPQQAEEYIALFTALGYPPPTLIINTEQGAEYVYDEGGVIRPGTKRLKDYTSVERGEWVKRTHVSQLALGVHQVYFYNYRQTDNELPPDDPNVIAAFQFLHDNGGGWLYRCGRTASNKLYIGWLDPLGAQHDEIH